MPVEIATGLTIVFSAAVLFGFVWGIHYLFYHDTYPEPAKEAFFATAKVFGGICGSIIAITVIIMIYCLIWAWVK